MNQRQSWIQALVALACVLEAPNTWHMKYTARASVSPATTSLNNNENHLLQNKARKRKGDPLGAGNSCNYSGILVQHTGRARDHHRNGSLQLGLEQGTREVLRPNLIEFKKQTHKNKKK